MQAIKVAKEVQNKDELIKTAISEFGTYTNLVQNATDNTKEFNQSKLPKKLKESVLKVLESNKKQKKYLVSYIATIYTFNTLSGATELKGIMGLVKGMDVSVKYIGAPKYRLMAEGDNYSTAEEKIKKVEELIKSKLLNGVFEMEKEKLKKANEDILSTISA